MLKKFLALALAMAMSASLVACGGNGQNAGNNGQNSGDGGSEDENYHLALMAPITGSEAQYGESMILGCQIAIDEINASGGVNGKQVVLDTFDDENDATAAANVSQLIVQDKRYDAVIGSYSSTCGLATGSIFDEAQMPIINPCSAHEDLALTHSYVFQRGMTASYFNPKMAENAVKVLGAKRVAVLALNNDAGILFTQYVTDEIEETIRGISVPIRRHEYTKAEPNVYRALRLSRMEEGYYEGMIDAVRLCVRVRPDVDNADFPARFRKDMAEQLRLGNLYLLDVQPLSYIRDGYIRSIGVENEVKTRVAVACFLLANIFLGIIGTFWFRTEQRKGEMGLRIALGSTRFSLKGIMIAEGVLLLTLIAVPALLICFNLHVSELTKGFYMDYTIARFAAGFLITYLVMAVMIILGIWYPAHQMARLEPADALRYE